MTEIKVCGIKKEEDLLSLIDLNVTWAGFVFFKKSIRNVDYKKKELFKVSFWYILTLIIPISKIQKLYEN